MIEDKKINEIIDRAENYRKELKENEFKTFASENNKEKNELGEIVGKIFSSCMKENEKRINNKNNIFIDYKLIEDEAIKGCKKIVKYKYIDKNQEKINAKLKVQFPKGLEDGTKIIINNCGNYIKENNKYSNLIITVKVK